MPEYTEEQKAARQKAVRNYEKNNYRLNIVFPKGTKERIEKLGLDKTNSAFIRDTVLAKLDELEKIKAGTEITGDGSGQYQYCKQYEDLPDCKEEICRKVYGASAGNGQDASKVHEIPEAVLLCRIEGRNVLYHASQAILQICRKDRK